MEPLTIVLILLAIAAVWAVVELALTIRKARTSLDELSHSATEAIDQATPVISKLDGVADELQPALRDVPALLEKVTVTVDEANTAMGSVNGILGDVSSATHGVANVGENASRIVGTATSAAVGVVSKVASFGGINIPEGQQLISGKKKGPADADVPPAIEAHVPAEAPAEEEPAAPRGGYVTYAPVSSDEDGE